MKMFALSLLSLLAGMCAKAQETPLPYAEIPAYPEKYTAATVAARLLDGRGFRYYWATEGLRPEDLVHKPSAEARTSEETLAHIYELSSIIANSTAKTANNLKVSQPSLSFTEMRKKTLENFKSASDKLKASSDKDLEDYDMVFQRGDMKREFPFWNELNGPIADALWHIGQVVSFRRSSGNPFNEKANVLTGTVDK